MRTNLKKYPVLFYYFCEKHSQMKKTFTIQELVSLLSCEGQEEEALFHKAQQVKNENVGNLVYLRGLIEISNICVKDCLYCGIRHSNNATTRYSLSDEEVLEAGDLRDGGEALRGGLPLGEHHGVARGVDHDGPRRVGPVERLGVDDEVAEVQGDPVAHDGGDDLVDAEACLEPAHEPGDQRAADDACEHDQGHLDGRREVEL